MKEESIYGLLVRFGNQPMALPQLANSRQEAIEQMESYNNMNKSLPKNYRYQVTVVKMVVDKKAGSVS
jgi:hypothetical protein